MKENQRKEIFKFKVKKEKKIMFKKLSESRKKVKKSEKKIRIKNSRGMGRER